MLRIMPRRQKNKLAPSGAAGRAGNFLLNILIAAGWLLRWCGRLLLRIFQRKGG